jgi:glyoxalase superfamily protein
MPVPWLHAFIDVPAERVEAAQAFWSAVIGWPPGDGWDGHPEFMSLVPPTGTPYVHVQSIGGPPRVHLDLVGDLDRDVAQLEELGAASEYRAPHGR